MGQYTYSYKLDSSNENIGVVEANNIDEAISLVSRIKCLDIDTTLELFNIKKVKNDTQNPS